MPAAQRAHPTLQDDDSPLKGAQDPDKLAPVNPDLHEEEEVVGVVDSGKVVAASRGAGGGGRGRGAARGRGRGGRGRGSQSLPATDESEEEAAQKRRKYTDEEERHLLDVMGLREFRARFANRTEKKDKVWVAVTDCFNEEMRRRHPHYTNRTMAHLRQKWDNQLRAARRHNLFVLKNNGTQGGSGNGRDVLESRVPPPYYEELLEAGWLQGPLSNPIHVMNGGTNARDLDTGVFDSQEVAEHAASWAGDDLPDTQEPYGGFVESRALVDKKKQSGDSGGSKGPGRPSKMGQLMKASEVQAQVLADASLEGGNRMAEALTAAVKLQVDAAREGRKAEAKLRMKLWKEERKENRRHRAAMVECMSMLAQALMGMGPDARREGS